MGSSITFSNNSINADSYSWSFGDGSTSASSTPVHIYSDTGTFTVQLTINNDTALSKQLTLKITSPPGYTYLLNGIKTWRHTTGKAFSSGWDTTFYLPDTSFAINYIDPGTISVGVDTLFYAYTYTTPGTDSMLYFTKSVPNNTGHSTSTSLSFRHTAPDSIRISILDVVSPGGAETEDFYAP